MNKLEREKTRAEEALENEDYPALVDAFYNFSVTAFHVKDWLITQVGLDKNEAHEYLKNVPVFQACRDICNTKKHFEITNYEPGKVTVGSTLTEICAVVPNEDGGADIYGKIDIWVDVGNDEVYRIVGFMEKVLEEWGKYHEEKGI